MNPQDGGEEAGRTLDLSGGRDQEVFNLLEEAFQGWSNASSVDEETYRSPADRREAKRARELIEKVKAIGTENELLRMRIQELDAVIDAIPEIPWRRLVVPIILTIIPLIFLLVSKSRSDDVEAWALEVREAVWTVAEDAPLHRASFDASDDAVPLRVVRKGARVNPLASRGGLRVQVRLETGEVGWLEVLALEEGRVLITESGTKFYSVNPYRANTGPSQMGRLRDDLREDQVELLPPGATATAVEMLPLARGWEMILPDSRRGFVLHGQSGMVPKVLGELPVLRHQHARVYTKERIDERAIGMTMDELAGWLGDPAFLTLHEPARGRGSAGYGSKLLAVVGSRRHEEVVFTLEERVVTGVEIGEHSKRVWVESLPMAAWLRDNVDLNGTFLQEWEYDYPRPRGWYPKLKGRSWMLAVPLVLLEIVLGLGLLFGFPVLATVPIRFPLLFVSQLPRFVVIWLSMAVLFAASYLYFLVVTLFVAPHPGGVSVFAAYDLLFVPLGLALLLMLKSRGVQALYHRCPTCRQMYSAIGRGTEHMGTTRSVDWVARDVLVDKVETATTVTYYYKRHWDQVITTKNKYMDHRECAFCHELWGVKRSTVDVKVVKG